MFYENEERTGTEVLKTEKGSAIETGRITNEH
jgi:hypothetical protein